MSKKLEKDTINKAIDLLVSGGADLTTLFAKDGLLKQLSKNIVERALKSEMEDHLGYEHYARSDSSNARNGSFSKNLITDNGVIDIDVPNKIDNVNNFRTEDGGSYLHYAASSGNIKLVEILVKKGAKLDAEDHYGRKPLNFAEQNQDDEMSKFLNPEASKNNIEKSHRFNLQKRIFTKVAKVFGYDR